MGCQQTKQKKNNTDESGKAIYPKDKEIKDHHATRSNSTRFLKKPSFMNPINIEDIQNELNDNQLGEGYIEMFNHIKAGDLKKVHALIQSQNIQNLMQLKGHDEVFQPLGLNMKDWNPLLVAIAYQRSEILKYLIANIKLSVRVAGRDPRYPFTQVPHGEYLTEKIQRQMFCMDIVVQNQDKECFHLLWDQYQVWDTPHFQLLIENIAERQWTEAIDIMYNSYTADDILCSESHETVRRLVLQWLDKAVNQTNNSGIFIKCLKTFRQIAFEILQYSLTYPQLPSNILKDIIGAHVGHLHAHAYQRFKSSISGAEFQDFLEKVKEYPELENKLTVDLIKQIQAEQIEDYITKQENLLNEVIENIDVFIETMNKYDFRTFEYVKDSEATRLLQQAASELGYQRVSEAWITPIQKVLIDYKMDEQHKMKVIILLRNRGLNIWQIFRVLDGSRSYKSEQESMKSAFLDIGNVLYICVKQNLIEILDYILTHEYNELWRYEHINIALQTAITIGRDQAVLSILKSECFKQYYQAFTTGEKISFMNMINAYFGHNPTVEQLDILSSQPFSSVYLFQNLHREAFKQLKTYKHFEKALQQFDNMEMDQIVASHSDIFKKFMKFFMIQDHNSGYYIYGMKVHERFLSIKPYKQLSIQMENESVFYNDDDEDEDIIEEENIQLQVMDYVSITKRGGQNILNLDQLRKIVEEKDENALLLFFQTHKNLDLVFLKLKTREEIEVYTVNADSEEIKFDLLNMVQITAACDMSDTAIGFFMNQYETLLNPNQKKQLPAHALLYNSYSNFLEGSSLFLRLLVSWGRMTTLYSILEGCKHNWVSHNILTVVQVLIGREEWDFLERVLDMSITMDIYLNSPRAQRKVFCDTIQALQDGEASYIYQQFEQAGFLEAVDAQASDNVKERMYQAIKNNNVEELRRVLPEVKYVNDVVFENYDKNPDCNLDYLSYTVRKPLNPILMSIYYGSFQCLQELLNKFPKALREALRGELGPLETITQVYLDRNISFDNLGMAILAFNPNQQILVALLKQEGFIPSHSDYVSLLTVYFLNKNYNEAKSLLKSFNMQVVYTSIPYHVQKALMKDILLNDKQILSVLQRPYLKACFAVLLEERERLKGGELIAQECLKGLTSEDFTLLMYQDYELIGPALNDINCRNQKLKEEIKKVLNRIRNEVINQA